MSSMSGASATAITIGQATDIADMVAMQPQWRLNYQQLSAGGYQGRIVHAALPGLHITQETSSKAIRQQGSLFKEDIGLALAYSPGGPCRFHGQKAGSDVVMVGLGQELDLTMPDDCHLLATLMPRASFLGLMAQWHPGAAEQSLSGPMTWRLAPEKAGHLRRLMQGLLQLLTEHPGWNPDHAAVRQMQDALVLAWQDALAGHGAAAQNVAAPGLAHRRELVERACRHVRGSLPDQLPTMLELCKVLGASPRKLEYCFRDVLGMPPARYLRLMRLNCAHHDLAHPPGAGMTVQEVASRWGFWHMGAFASDYKRMFGRSPSRTLGAVAR
jgi:AraC family ethanolamine operon transcriptional activator